MKATTLLAASSKAPIWKWILIFSTFFLFSTCHSSKRFQPPLSLTELELTFQKGMPRKAFVIARKLNQLDGYYYYLKYHPNSKYAKRARRKLNAWSAAAQQELQWAQSNAQLPSSTTAQKFLAVLMEDMYKRIFLEPAHIISDDRKPYLIAAGDTKRAIDLYLEEYPNGVFKAQIKQRLTQANNGAIDSIDSGKYGQNNKGQIELNEIAPTSYEYKDNSDEEPKTEISKTTNEPPSINTPIVAPPVGCSKYEPSPVVLYKDKAINFKVTVFQCSPDATGSSDKKTPNKTFRIGKTMKAELFIDTALFQFTYKPIETEWQSINFPECTEWAWGVKTTEQAKPGAYNWSYKLYRKDTILENGTIHFLTK